MHLEFESAEDRKLPIQTVQSFVHARHLTIFRKNQSGSAHWCCAGKDGYHELLTVYQTIGLHDLMRVSIETGIRNRDSVCGRRVYPRMRRILVIAWSSVRCRSCGRRARVLIQIEKRLAGARGLGRGVGECGEYVAWAERVLKKSLPAAERLRIVAEVGSDLPLFLLGGTVLGVGRGEQVYPLAGFAARCLAWWLRRRLGCQRRMRLRNGIGGTSSRAALGWTADGGCPYRFQRKLTHDRGASDRMSELGCGLSAWLSEQYSGAPFGRGRAENPLLALVRAGIKNDFEEVVFPEYPELGEAKNALLRAGAKYASCQVLGSTCTGCLPRKRQR